MALALEAALVHIPRFTWRVESTKSRYYRTSANELQHVTDEELRSWISTHMIGEYYDAPCEITSLTGSLLWGLNYAHWLLSRGYGDIQIFLVDTWKMPKGRIYPAKFLATYLGVAPRNIHWHDDPYHEYFMFGGVPSNAILGSVNLESVRGREINTLLPGFHQLDRDERLHESLDRFRKSWTNIFGFPADAASVTNDDIWAAGWTAGRILQNPDKNIHFQIAMMFLSLRKRDWNKEVWVEIQNVFEGVCIPSRYLYKSRGSDIDFRMPDVVEWVNGMEHVRTECIIANTIRPYRIKSLLRHYNKSG